MADTIYVEGMRVFPPHQNAPDFVKGSLIITPRELVEFFKTQADNMTEYNGKKQLRCQILEGNKGLYFTVDTYKPKAKPEAPEAPAEDGLPF